MTQIHEPPPQHTERIERPAYGPGGFEPVPVRPRSGRTAAVVLMLLAITLVAAGVGFLLAGGRLPSTGATPTPASVAQSAPSVAPGADQSAPTALPPPATAPKPENVAPTAPTSAPAAPPQPTAPPAATVPQPTAPPQPTAAPKPAEAPPAPAAAEKPANTSAAPSEGVHVPVRPGTDARMAQIEGRVNEYFAALSAQDYARAQQVCCTPEWRARFPLDRWQRNFDGVTDLRLVGAPRYQQVQDDLVVVDTDYTFQSGGVRRNFTLRWTFKPVGSEWQADLAEAFPTQ